MTRRNPLRIVDEPPEQPVDVTLALRADIMKRDWAACHIEGDRRAPWRKLVWRG